MTRRFAYLLVAAVFLLTGTDGTFAAQMHGRGARGAGISGPAQVRPSAPHSNFASGRRIIAPPVVGPRITQPRINGPVSPQSRFVNRGRIVVPPVVGPQIIRPRINGPISPAPRTIIPPFVSPVIRAPSINGPRIVRGRVFRPRIISPGAFIGGSFLFPDSVVTPPVYVYPNYDSSVVNQSEEDLANQVQQLAEEVEQLRESIQSSQPSESSTAPAESAPTPSPAVLIFRDGRRMEVQNYAVVGQTLWILDQNSATKIPLSDLDLQATERENRSRGIRFRAPAQ